jgi:hypothetical protein
MAAAGAGKPGSGPGDAVGAVVRWGAGFSARRLLNTKKRDLFVPGLTKCAEYYSNTKDENWHRPIEQAHFVLVKFNDMSQVYSSFKPEIAILTILVIFLSL